jgi:hypothetical protein
VILKIIATALTGIGGHFLNRRWDKATLFFCAFVFYGIFCFLGVSYLDSVINQPESPNILPFLGSNKNLPIIVSRFILAGYAVLLIMSIISTMFSGGDNAEQFPKWSISSKLTAWLMSFLSFSVISFSASGYLSIASYKIEKSTQPIASGSNPGTGAGANPELVEKKMKASREDWRKMDAAEVLLDVGMLAEAKKLLDLVDSQSGYGRKELLTSAIFALQGDCVKAKELLNQAVKINPQTCIIEKYKDLCK